MGAGGDNTTGHAGTNGQANLSNGAVMSDSKLGHGWVPPTNRTNASELTTNSGMGYSDPDRSLTVGARGTLSVRLLLRPARQPRGVSGWLFT